MKKTKTRLKKASESFFAAFNKFTGGSEKHPILDLQWKQSWGSTGRSKNRHAGLHEGFEEPLKAVATFAAEVSNVNQQLMWESRNALLDLSIERKDKTSLDAALQLGLVATGLAKTFLMPVSAGGASLTSLGKAGGDALKDLSSKAVSAGLEALVISTGSKVALIGKEKALGKKVNGKKVTKESAKDLMDQVAENLEEISPGNPENEKNLKIFGGFFKQARQEPTILKDTIILAAASKLKKFGQEGDQYGKTGAGGIAKIGNN